VITKGAIIINIKDPRHVGRVVTVHTRGTMAKVVWIETGWIELSVPIGDLRTAPKEYQDAPPPVTAQERLRLLVERGAAPRRNSGR
jgi:hypothetical protein